MLDLLLQQFKKSSKDVSRLSALELATMGKNLSAKELAKETGEEGPVMTNVEMDAEDKDWQQLVVDAKSQNKRQSPFSWFARKVDFSLNGTKFVGKVGYSVTSGVLPLFDGAVLDLKSANLLAKKPEEVAEDDILGPSSWYDNWVEGDGGMLVLAPVGMDNAVPVPIRHVTATEGGLSARAEKQIEFHSGEKKVVADGVRITHNTAVLEGTKYRKNDTSEFEDVHFVEITGRGIRLPEDNASEKDILQEQINEEPQAAESTEDSPQMQEYTRQNNFGLKSTIVNKATGFIDNLELKYSTQDDEEEEENLHAEDEGIVTPLLDAAQKVYKGEAEGFVEDLAARFAHNIFTGKKEEDEEDSSDESSDEDEEEDSEFEIDFSVDMDKGDLSLEIHKKEEEEEDEDPLITAMAKEAAEDAGAVVHDAIVASVKEKSATTGINMIKDAAKESFNTAKDNVDEIASKVIENPEENLKVLNDGLYGNYDEEEMEEIVNNFLGREKEEKEENDEDEDENKNKVEIDLLDFMLLPTPLSFKAKFGAEWDVSPYVKLDVKNLISLVKEEKPNFDVMMEAGLKAELSMGLSAGLAVGIPFLIEGYAGVNAKANLKGAGISLGEGTEGAADRDGVALAAKVKLPLTYDKKKKEIKQADDMNVNMGAGLNLTGSVGAESSVESKLFLWQKTLFEKDFAEWDLATINFNFAARKKPPADGGRNGFFQGWEFDTANIELTGPDTGLGAAFTENNNPANNYGLTTTDMAPSKEYQDLQENFDTAVKLLEEFSNPQDGRTLVVPEEPDESGASEVTSKLKEQISNNFIVIWAGAQNELMLVRQTLDDYMNDGGHQAKEEQARKNVEKHSRTLSSLHVWKMQNKAANQNSEAAADKTDEKQTNAGQLLEFYNSGTNTGGHGFKKHLENRAKDEAYNFDNLLKHERERYIEKTQKHTHRILELKRLMAANRGDKEIIDYYKDTLKGSRAFKNKVAVQTVGELKKFETQKMLENQKGAREHANNTKAMLDKLSKGYEDKNGFFGGRKKYGRTEFFKEFADSLSVSSSLYCFGNKDYLVNYEKSRLLKIGGDDAKYYMNLLEGKDQFEGTDTTEKNKKKEDQKIKENYYLSATLAELREYEEQINAGEYGKALSSYTKGQEEGRPKSDNELNNIFGNKKRKALKTFKKRLRNRSVDDNIKFISLDLLAEYIRKRQRNTSDMKIKKQLAEELQYVSNAKLRLLNIVDEEQLQEKEAEMVKEYFNRFTASAKEYQYDLETGKEVNLALMQVAFREDPDNERMNLLDKMTNDDGQEPDHFIIRQYIEAKGVDKKKLTEFLLQKRGADAFTEDNKRKFYAASMAKDKGSRKHLNRLDKLMEVSEQGTYDDLLKAYEESGGGEGYAEQIKKELATGFVGGRMISTEEVVEYENRQIRLAGTLQEDVIKLFAGMSDDQMIGDGELLQKYKERSIANEAKQKGFGAIGGSVKNAIASRGIDIDTQYEKSLKKVELTPQELLSYEIMRKEELGRKHMERIRSLLGAEAVTDEQIEKNQLPQPENVEELEDRRQAYINNAKRFEKDDDIKGQAEANLKRMMGDEDFLYKEMVEYESQRKDYYERQFIELMQAHTNLNNQIAVLEHEENISRQIVGKLDAIEHNPKIIFDEIETFRSAVDKMKTQPEEDEKMRQRQKELIQEVKDRIEQAEMLDYSDEED